MANKAESPFKEIDHLTEKHMQVILTHWILMDRKHRSVAPNIQFIPYTKWESDLVSISHSDYAFEYEIKIDRWDFIKDAKKAKMAHYRLLKNSFIPFRKFYYAVPEGMVSVDEVPSFAGLIYVSQHGNSNKPLNAVVKVVKQAPNRKVSKVTQKQISQLNRSLAWKLHNGWLAELEKEVANG